MKRVKAIPPYLHPEYLNFKMSAYQAWRKVGGQVAKAHYPFRALHGLFFRYEFPTIWKGRKEARLRFVEPISLSFDTFPDYARYEIIPFMWDCWPCYFERVCTWFKKHKVRTAIFTSSQTANQMRKCFPEMNIMHCPEGINISNYIEGKPLVKREIDLLEFGRSNDKVVKITLPESRKHVCTKVGGSYVFTNEQLYAVMGDAKVTIALPRNITEPQKAGDIETLTQRYWENMLSRIVMVGHAPKELVELIGYNPVVEMDCKNPCKQILDILDHIDRFQELVDRNRAIALQKSDWTSRMKQVMDFLKDCGYKV